MGHGIQELGVSRTVGSVDVPSADVAAAAAAENSRDVCFPISHFPHFPPPTSASPSLPRSPNLPRLPPSPDFPLFHFSARGSAPSPPTAAPSSGCRRSAVKTDQQSSVTALLRPARARGCKFTASCYTFQPDPLGSTARLPPLNGASFGAAASLTSTWTERAAQAIPRPRLHRESAFPRPCDSNPLPWGGWRE